MEGPPGSGLRLFLVVNGVSFTKRIARSNVRSYYLSSEWQGAVLLRQDLVCGLIAANVVAAAPAGPRAEVERREILGAGQLSLLRQLGGRQGF